MYDQDLLDTGAKYLQKKYNIDGEQAYSETYEDERFLLDEITSLEACIDLVRNTPGGIGHICDNLYGIRRKYIDLYELKFNKPYEYYNEDII